MVGAGVGRSAPGTRTSGAGAAQKSGGFRTLLFSDNLVITQWLLTANLMHVYSEVGSDSLLRKYKNNIVRNAAVTK